MQNKAPVAGYVWGSLTRMTLVCYADLACQTNQQRVTFCETMRDIILTIPHNPPYHTEIEMPALPKPDVLVPWPGWKEVTFESQEAFLMSCEVCPVSQKEIRQNTSTAS